MLRSAVAVCLLLLLIGPAAAPALSPASVRVSAAATQVPPPLITIARTGLSLCGEGMVSCNGRCTDIRFDKVNCGSCGMTCFDPAVCCNGVCVDLMNDGENCGSCGMTCFDPAACCTGSCRTGCTVAPVHTTPAALAQVHTTPSELAQVHTTPSELAQVHTTPSEVAHIDTTPVPGMHGLAGAPANTALTTVAPQNCPAAGGWTCMPLAQAAAQFGIPYAQSGIVPCGYLTNSGQTIAEYCCRDITGGSVPAASPGATGLSGANSGLHIMNRTPAGIAGSEGVVRGRIVGQQTDLVSRIFGLLTGLFTGSVSCPEGKVNCNGKCTDTGFDTMNCGSCGMTCFDPAVCCNGQCVDLMADAMNCGFCGMTCFDPAVCCSGRCDDPSCPIPIVVVTPTNNEVVVVTPTNNEVVVVTPADNIIVAVPHP